MGSKQQMDESKYRELQTMGMEGKLWAVTVLYKSGSETKTYTRRNMDGEETMKFRNRMFQFGFEISVEPGHWKIICPMDIYEVDMYKQTRYLPDGAALIDPNEAQVSG